MNPNEVPDDDDPGIRADSFPELIDDSDPKDFNPRVAPDAAVILDLENVLVENSIGEWVPVVPTAHKIVFGYIRQCHCGKYRFGKKRYQEHYAYGHILGMDD